MAQTGFTPIQLYFSSTASNVPLAANLANGELAINTADGRLFYKDSSGAVQTIATASTVANAVLTTGNQTIGGIKTFSSTIVGSINGNAATATNVAYTGLTGTVPTWNQNTTGNAATATLATTATNQSGGTVSATTGAFSGVASFAAGTAAAPSITRTGDTNTGVFFPAADTIAFTNAGAETMRIDNLGNIGIGLPPNFVNVLAVSSIYGTEFGGHQFVAYGESFDDAQGSSAIRIQADRFQSLANTAAIDIIANDSLGLTGIISLNLRPMIFSTNSTERIRIESNGDVGIGTNLPAQRLDVSGTARITSLGVGTTASGTTGEIRATNNITAFFSDDRLKTRHSNIENALAKLHTLDGFYYTPNQVAQDLGYAPTQDIGVSAQAVQAILPEVVAPAPIDDKYLTVRYEKLVPLLIEAIKELSDKVDHLQATQPRHIGN